MRQLYTVLITAITLSHTIAPARARVATAAAPSPQEFPQYPQPLLAEWSGASSVESRRGTSSSLSCSRPRLRPLAEEHREIEAIAGSADPPTFENTIAAMQRAERHGIVSCGCSRS